MGCQQDMGIFGDGACRGIVLGEVQRRLPYTKALAFRPPHLVVVDKTEIDSGILELPTQIRREMDRSSEAEVNPLVTSPRRTWI